MNWDFFEKRVCLTTNPVEWQKAELEFERVGLTVEKFQSLPDIGPHQSFCKSVRQILINFKESEAQTLLHLEDDCIFRDYSHLETALQELPSNWDIVYLGANLLVDGNGYHPQQFSPHLFRVKSAWTTHAIAYRKKCVEFLIENQPDDIMFDTWLSTELKRLKAYIVAPMVAYQRQHLSLIWGTDEDYTHLFDASNERLK